MKRLNMVLYVLLQCSWGLGATLIGLGFFLANCRCEHRRYRCCIDTHWKVPAGLSLGLFIFTPEGDQPIRVHEYGHTIQNLVLGPLMAVVGIISVTWATLPYFGRRRREKGIPYTACFVEGWASRWGERVTGEKAI